VYLAARLATYREAKTLIMEWTGHHNEKRPHSSLGSSRKKAWRKCQAKIAA
jgi:hypothetical protein